MATAPRIDNAGRVPLIAASGIARRYGRGESAVDALRGVDLEIRRGEMVALMGPSGSGKSTLMHILGLLDRPSAGSYRLEGSDVTAMGSRAAAEMRGRRIAFVFQQIRLIPRLTLQKNVELPMVYARMPRAERTRRALMGLKGVGLGHLAARLPSQVSGGQAQRAAIARAVAPGPDILLADEPTGALDRASGRDVLAIFQQLNASLGLTVVLVTHDLYVARHAGRVIELEDGRIVADREVRDRLFAQPGGGGAMS